MAEIVNERGLDIHHTTVFRWVKRCPSGNDSLRLTPTAAANASRLRRETRLQRWLASELALKKELLENG